MATRNGTLAAGWNLGQEEVEGAGAGAGAGDREGYDSAGAVKFIVVTVGIYSLMGVLSLLLVRIVRRAKLRLC